jgi:hypothetical protein
METTAAADEDEITESLIETFPASDPPAWVALARVGIPKRRAIKPFRSKKASLISPNSPAM